MPQDDTPELTSQQKQAARLEFAAEMNADGIAAEIGVSRETIYRWRRKIPAYCEYVESLHKEANRLTVLELVRLRKRALRGLYAGAGKLQDVLTTPADAEDAPSTYDVVQSTKALHDIVKATSAQTGISEKQSVEHSGHIDGGTVVHITSDAAHAIAEADLEDEG